MYSTPNDILGTALVFPLAYWEWLSVKQRERHYELIIRVENTTKQLPTRKSHSRVIGGGGDWSDARRE